MDAAELSPGTLLDDRYEIVRTLGRGGMGVVYLARDLERDGASIALKVLPEALSADPHGLELLKQEASVAMRLSHPNIVRLHNLEGRARKFVTMEYVDGGSLADLLVARVKGQLARPPGWSGPGLSPAEVAPLLAGMAAGLDHAHAERVIHRDMKPANVLLKRRGEEVVPKIADFGIAREIRELVSRATQVVVAGTPPFMSPEHLRGEKLDARADVYALAATVYTLLAARPPFTGGDLPWQILNRAPEAIPGVPARVMATVTAGMAKEAGHRPRSCGELAAAFASAIAGGASDEATQEAPVATEASAPVATAPAPASAVPTSPATPAALSTTTPTAPFPSPRPRRTALIIVPLAALALAAAAWWRPRPAHLPLPTESVVPVADDARREQQDQLVSDLINAGRIENAELELRALGELTNHNVRDWIALGRRFYLRDHKKAGEAAWAHALSARPAEAKLLLEKVGQELLDAGHPEQARAAAAAIRQVDRFDPWPRELEMKIAGKPEAAGAATRLKERYAAGDAERALLLLDSLKQDAPEDPVSLAIAADLLARHGRLDEARARLGRLPPVKQLPTEALHPLALAAEGVADWPRTLEAAEAWASVSGDAAAFQLCGVAWQKQGQPARAAAMFRQARLAKPSSH